MNDTTIKTLHAVADHLETHDLARVLSVDTHGTSARINLYTDPGESRIGAILQAADTLNRVELVAVPHVDSYQLNANGTTAGGLRLTFVAIVKKDREAEFEALAEELGGYDPDNDKPVTRTQLAKIADPELLDDRPFMTEEQLAEVEHWSKTPMPHEVTS